MDEIFTNSNLIYKSQNSCQAFYGRIFIITKALSLNNSITASLMVRDCVALFGTKDSITFFTI